MTGRRVLALALAALLAACEPVPWVVGESGLAPRQNHPNELVAKRLEAMPVSYPLRFALLSDTHHPHGDPVFAEIREQLLQLSPRPAFIVLIGDFVEQGWVEEHLGYIAIIDELPIPVFSVIGNHEQYPDAAGRPAGNRRNYARYFGPEDFSFSFAGSRFIAMNDIVPRRNGLTDAQIGWLEEQLADPATPDRYLFMHASPPILPPPWGPPPFFNVERLYALCERYGVRLVVSGHVHEFRHRLQNGVQYLGTGGGGGALDPKLVGLQDPPDQAILHNFLLVTVKADGRSSVELVPAGDSAAPAQSFTVDFQTTVK